MAERIKGNEMLYSPEYFKDIEYTLERNDISGLKKKRLLITGATGLIGSALIDMLIYMNEEKEGNIEIFAASREIMPIRNRFSPYSEKRYFHAMQYNAMQPLSINEAVDYIICGAGNAHPEIIGKEPVETMLANFCGINGLLEYARGHDVKRVLYISSSEIYGRKNDHEPYKENDYGYIDLLNPRACYPCSKRAGETLCAAYFKEYGVDSVIVRPGHIYGPTQTERDSRASAQFIWSAVKGKDIVMKSDGLQQRSYCHCFDCATAILSVLLRGEAGNAYNISNSSSIITIREYAEFCASIVDKKVIFMNSSKNEKENYNMMDRSALNSEKLENLGWNGIWEAEEGILETIRVLRRARS